MKNKNNPSKKNARRITVSLRLSKRLMDETDAEKIEVLKGELERVNAKIIPEEAARMRRTKKYRAPKTY